MDNQSSAAVEDGGRVFFRDVKPYAIVDRLDQLRGPAGGTVELSHSVLWAPGGGLVDLEFLIHFMQLRDRRGLAPGLGDALGQLVEAGSLTASLQEHHDFLTRLLVSSRLLSPDMSVPAAAAMAALARACGCDSGEALVQRLWAARIAIAQSWQAVFDERLEIDDA